MKFSSTFIKGISLFSLATKVSATFDASSNQNVVVYWGQASAGSQEDLSYYCDSDDVDIVVLSFMTSFPGTNDVPTLNFASACSEQFSNGLLKCTQIATDIKSCQSNGKKVLLSLGGESGSYGFSSDSDAEDFAGVLWDLFGEGSSDTRPFGESVIDGFDFDIENNEPAGYAALAKELRQYFESGSKNYYLSAAPQCVYPDASLGDLLENADIDFAFVQFYNNYCNVDKQFNWDTWTDYAANTSPNKDIKIYLGLPGSSSAAGSGYIDISKVKSTISTIGADSAFGGVMLWDASQSFTNKVDGTTYAGAVKEALESLGDSSSTQTSSSTQASSTQASTQTSSTQTSSTQTSSTQTSSTQTTSSSVQPSSTISSTATSTSQTLAVSKAATSAPQIEASSLGSASATQTSSVVELPSTVQPSVPNASSSTFTVSTTSTDTVSTQPSSQEVANPTSNSLSYPEVTSNTFTTGLSTLSSVLISSTPQTGLSNVQTTTYSLSNTIEPSASTPVTPSSSATPSDCSSLTGVSKAQCLNQNYKAGEFNGETSQCTNGAIACSSSGQYAVCNWGSWVTYDCAAGTTCYAYNQDDSVFTGCNYSSQESLFTKRSIEHGHHDHI